MGRLRISGNTQRPRKVMATLGHRLNLAKNETVSCWMVQHNGGALLDGKITDYLIKTKQDDGSNLDNTNNSNENKQKSVHENEPNAKQKLEKVKPETEKDSKSNVFE